VSPPGPPGALWAVSLLLWAGSSVVLGEAVRTIGARAIPFWRIGEPVERLVTDLYVGGGTLYLLAAVQLGIFAAPVVRGLPIAAAVFVLYRVGRARARRTADRPAAQLAAAVGSPWTVVAFLSALGLFLVEIAAALPVPTGNTLDSSLLTIYTTQLLQHGSVPLSFRPYGTTAILYPQGSTVWFAWAQGTFGLPPARTALLVTPLFLALPPLSGYVLGLRWFRSERVGAAFAVALAFLGPSTRSLAAGSNDFVLATPLVLLLAAQARLWFDRGVPSLANAAGFGLLVGYAGAINVVGTEWLLPALLVLGVVATPRFGGRLLAWGGRWATTVATALLAGVPSIYVLVSGAVRPGSLDGALSAPARASVGISAAQLVGSLDPFLFRGSSVALSPIPIVRAELAVLLVVGVGVLLLANEEGDGGSGRFARWAASCGLAVGGWLVILYVAHRPGSPLRALPFVSNSQELSMSLFLLYGLVAAIPLAVAFGGGRLERQRPAATDRPRRARPAESHGRRTAAAVAFAIVVVVPAAVLTPASLGPVLADTYQDFGNVTAADFDLFGHAAGWFAPGARLLVAPGSAAQFLPGYAPGIVLVLPMAPGWSRANASYNAVVRDLSNGTLDAGGRAALASLAVDFVVVTGNSTVLWPAFWAAPLVHADYNVTNATTHTTSTEPTFPVLWHEADAWVFDASACRPGSAACG